MSNQRKNQIFYLPQHFRKLILSTYMLSSCYKNANERKMYSVTKKERFINVTCSFDYRLGFGLDIGFTDHLQVVTTNNYNTIAISTLYKITLSFPARSVFTRRFLIMASNSGDSSASALKSSLNGGSLPTDSFLHRLPFRTDLVAPVVFLITPRHGPHRQYTILIC
jgi:hypothetical protein